MVHENKTVHVDLPGTLGYDWTTAATKHWWNTFSELHVKHCCTYMCTALCKLSPSDCSPSMATSNLNSILNLDHSLAQNEFFFCENKNQEAWANSTLAGIDAHGTRDRSYLENTWTDFGKSIQLKTAHGLPTHLNSESLGIYNRKLDTAVIWLRLNILGSPSTHKNSGIFAN